MPTAKEAPAAPVFDVRSAAPVLTYVGPGVVAGVPAADLSANQLARLAWISSGQVFSATAVPDTAIAAIRDELIASGKYNATKPKESDRE